MKSTLVRLATPARYLAPGTPTGLTGLRTHPSPRAELIALYTYTLSKLAKLPSHSAYRSSTEALTKHRLAKVEATKPAGWDEWKPKADALLQKYPNLFRAGHNLKPYVRYNADGKIFITEQWVPERDEDEMEFGGRILPQIKPGSRMSAEQITRHNEALEAGQLPEPMLDPAMEEMQKMREYEIGENEWIPEPKLNAEQISQLEDQIGAGLIEEVIEVARGELQLVDAMNEAQVWEELVEKPASGQWDYFQRDRNVSGTQEPPKV